MDQKRYILELTDDQLSDYEAHLSHPANIQDIPKPTKSEFGEDNNHPTIKPLKLMEWLVKLLSNQGDTVLDPFSGSGTTGVACKNLNREFIGIERDPDHVEHSRRRIEGRKKEANEFVGYD